jgi:Phage integrase family
MAGGLVGPVGAGVVEGVHHRTGSGGASAERAAGGPRFHDLRHSYTTWLVTERLRVNVVRRVMGHEQTTTTLDLYTHTPDDYEDRVRAALATLLPSRGLPNRLTRRAIPQRTRRTGSDLRKTARISWAAHESDDPRPGGDGGRPWVGSGGVEPIPLSGYGGVQPPRACFNARFETSRTLSTWLDKVWRERANHALHTACPTQSHASRGDGSNTPIKIMDRNPPQLPAD